jgi:hypothetical protein
MLFGTYYYSKLLKGLLQIFGLMLASFIVGFLLGAWIF